MQLRKQSYGDPVTEALYSDLKQQHDSTTDENRSNTHPFVMSTAPSHHTLPYGARLCQTTASFTFRSRNDDESLIPVHNNATTTTPNNDSSRIHNNATNTTHNNASSSIHNNASRSIHNNATTDDDATKFSDRIDSSIATELNDTITTEPNSRIGGTISTELNGRIDGTIIDGSGEPESVNGSGESESVDSPCQKHTVHHDATTKLNGSNCDCKVNDSCSLCHTAEHDTTTIKPNGHTVATTINCNDPATTKFNGRIGGKLKGRKGDSECDCPAIGSCPLCHNVQHPIHIDDITNITTNKAAVTFNGSNLGSKCDCSVDGSCSLCSTVKHPIHSDTILSNEKTSENQSVVLSTDAISKNQSVGSPQIDSSSGIVGNVKSSNILLNSNRDTMESGVSFTDESREVSFDKSRCVMNNVSSTPKSLYSYDPYDEQPTSDFIGIQSSVRNKIDNRSKLIHLKNNLKFASDSDLLVIRESNKFSSRSKTLKEMSSDEDLSSKESIKVREIVVRHIHEFKIPNQSEIETVSRNSVNNNISVNNDTNVDNRTCSRNSPNNSWDTTLDSGVSSLGYDVNNLQQRISDIILAGSEKNANQQKYFDDICLSSIKEADKMIIKEITPEKSTLNKNDRSSRSFLKKFSRKRPSKSCVREDDQNSSCPEVYNTNTANGNIKIEPSPLSFSSKQYSCEVIRKEEKLKKPYVGSAGNILSDKETKIPKEKTVTLKRSKSQDYKDNPRRAMRDKIKAEQQILRDQMISNEQLHSKAKQVYQSSLSSKERSPKPVSVVKGVATAIRRPSFHCSDTPAPDSSTISSVAKSASDRLKFSSQDFYKGVVHGDYSSKQSSAQNSPLQQRANSSFRRSVSLRLPKKPVEIPYSRRPSVEYHYQNVSVALKNSVNRDINKLDDFQASQSTKVTPLPRRRVNDYKSGVSMNSFRYQSRGMGLGSETGQNTLEQRLVGTANANLVSSESSLSQSSEVDIDPSVTEYDSDHTDNRIRHFINGNYQDSGNKMDESQRLYNPRAYRADYDNIHYTEGGEARPSSRNGRQRMYAKEGSIYSSRTSLRSIREEGGDGNQRKLSSAIRVAKLRNRKLAKKMASQTINAVFTFCTP